MILEQAEKCDIISKKYALIYTEILSGFEIWLLFLLKT